MNLVFKFLSVVSAGRFASFLILVTLATVSGRGHASCADAAVQVSATTVENPPSITLTWPNTVGITQYSIYRKLRTDNTFGTAVAQVGAAGIWTDTNVTPGVKYEYHISGLYMQSGFSRLADGYICSGIRIPAEDHHGTVILIVDTTVASALNAELEQLKQDFIGDGWSVIRHDVPRHTGSYRVQFGPIATTDPADVAIVKNLIKTDYAAAPAEVRSVLLFGHVPVPYAGSFAPDGHGDHVGAWPADVYYGDMTGTWTDTGTSTGNTPGDGRFDQTIIPAPVTLEVGRVDLSNLPSFAPSETELLRNYLNKDHKHRLAVNVLARRATVWDRFWDTGLVEGFGSSGYRAWAGMVGAANITYTDFGVATTNSYLCGYLADAGRMDGAGGTSTVSMAQQDYKIAFYLTFGSWFGDWNSTDNFLRAPLATSSYGLINAWSGRPNWFVHPVALGATWGEAAKLTQNNNNQFSEYTPQGFYPNCVQIALMGDPTLRLFSVLPPTNLTLARAGNHPVLTWVASPDATLGYHVFRASNAAGPFTRVTATPITTTTWIDSTVSAGLAYYQVKTIKLETTSSGTYENRSQALSGSIDVGTGNQAPTAIAQSVITNEDTAKSITLRGSDPEGSPLTFAIASQPAHGTVTLSGAAATYAPSANYNGADSFTFTANDGAQNSAPATVSISVAAVNDAPVATAQSVTTVAGTVKAIVLTGTDVEGSALSFAITTQPAHGTVTLSGATATYNPAANYTGADSFTFTANDGALTSAAATVSIVVTAKPNTPPNIVSPATASPNPATVGQNVGFVVAANDADNDALTYVWNFGDSSTASTANTTHSYAAAGTYNVSVTVSDGKASVVSSVSLVVNIPQNNPPVALFTATPTTGVAPLSVNFDASASSDSDGTIAAYAWQFGDGATAAGKTALHVYASGTFSVTLTVTDNLGSKTSTTKSIIVSAGDGLVAYWKLDETTGAIAKDSSGNSRDASVKAGTSWTTAGVINGALQFGGSGGYAMAPEMRNAFPDKTVTIAAWFKADGAGVIIDELNTTAPNNNQWHDSQIEILSDGTVKVRVWNLTAETIGKVAFGQWHHAVVRYNQATRTLDGFLDGIVAASSTVADRTAPWDLGYGLCYGLGATDSTNLGSGAYFKGSMDEVRIYNRALTAADVATLYSLRATNIPPVARLTATPTTGPAPLTVSFDGSTSSDSDGTIATYAWQFGDGATASGKTATHVYSLGTFTATLTVTDNLGATNSITTTITSTAPATGLREGGFETPNVGPAGNWFSFQYGPLGSAWSFVGGGGIAANVSGFTVSNPSAPEGVQVAFIQGQGSFKQTSTLNPGTYQLTFQAAQRKNAQASAQTFRTLVDGQEVGRFTPASGNYENCTTARFTLTAGAHTVMFEGLNPNGGDNTALLDNVILKNASVATATISLTADNEYTELYFNGNSIPPGANAKNLFAVDTFADVAALNCIAVKAGNYEPGTNWAGFCAKVILSGGTSLVSDATWKVYSNGTGTPPPNDASGRKWSDSGYDDSSWQVPTSGGTFGVGPWGNFTSSLSGAQWIWAGDIARGVSPVYFRKTLAPAAETARPLSSLAEAATPPPNSLTVTKLSGSILQKKRNMNACAVEGQFSSTLALKGLTLNLDVGGAIEQFTLNARGQGKTAHGTIRLTPSPKVKSSIIFKATLKHGDWPSLWVNQVDPTTKQTLAPVYVNLAIRIGDALYIGGIESLYSNRSKSTGTFHSIQ